MAVEMRSRIPICPGPQPVCSMEGNLIRLTNNLQPNGVGQRLNQGESRSLKPRNVSTHYEIVCRWRCRLLANATHCDYRFAKRTHLRPPTRQSKSRLVECGSNFKAIIWAFSDQRLARSRAKRRFLQGPTRLHKPIQGAEIFLRSAQTAEFTTDGTDCTDGYEVARCPGNPRHPCHPWSLRRSYAPK